MNAAPLVESFTDSQARYERALTMLHTHRGNPLAEVDRLLADDPGFVAGHCLRAALLVLSNSSSVQKPLAASIAAIESAGQRLPNVNIAMPKPGVRGSTRIRSAHSSITRQLSSIGRTISLR